MSQGPVSHQSSHAQLQQNGRLTLHHIGFAVSSIAEVGKTFAVSLGAEWNGEIIHDPLQSARVTFLTNGASTIELIEPDAADAPLAKFVAKGGGLHHLCYEVDHLQEQLTISRAAGCLIVKNPLPAVAFGGRMIAWVYTPQKLLIEYLER